MWENPISHLPYQVGAMQQSAASALAKSHSASSAPAPFLFILPEYKTKPNSHMKSSPDPRQELLAAAVAQHTDTNWSVPLITPSTPGLNLEKALNHGYIYIPPKTSRIRF